MAKQTIAPFFVGTACGLTFYKRHGKYFARKKSSPTAERVKTEACFLPSMQQAGYMARASKIGSVLYAAVPLAYKEHTFYRTLTGQANLRLKKGMHEQEIITALFDEYLRPLME